MNDTVKRKFTEVRKSGNYEALSKKYKLHPLILRIMNNRGVSTEEEIEQFLNGTIENLPSPHLLSNADLAADVIEVQIKQGKQIRVIGDYDIDGVMSSYILVKGLRNLGANVSVQIPHRITDGYGLNVHLIEEAHKDGVECIITCDNGISAIDEIALAKKYGITVVVTDHHRVTIGIPKADAVVNPHLPEDTYPFKEICGTTVAWKVLSIVYERFAMPKDAINEFVENVGFATVGDIMPLKGENRILVKHALNRIAHTKNLGMKALLAACSLDANEINAYHFGFVLGPCINATGRLDTAATALELFLTDDAIKARKIAAELVRLNEERKMLTEEGVQEAVRLYEESGYEKDPILVIYLPGVHESIAGIVAGRIKERYYKPTFILTDGEESVKGSARSIDGYSLSDEMSKHKDLFLKFGGHPKAAGLSIAKEQIDVLRSQLNADSPIRVEDEIETVRLDAIVDPSVFSIGDVEQLSVLEPFGNENPGPLFGASKLKVKRLAVIGKNKNVIRVTFQLSNGKSMDGMWFSQPDLLLDFIRERFGEGELTNAMEEKENQIVLSVVYQPHVNEFRGEKKLQMNLKYYL